MTSAEMLAQHVRDQAAWRWRIAQEYPEDNRNAQSATGLEELASYIEAHPRNPNLLVIEAWYRDHGLDHFAPGEETSRAIGCFRFHNPTESYEAFLGRVRDLIMQDHADWLSDQ